jgi:hypothetical protein
MLQTGIFIITKDTARSEKSIASDIDVVIAPQSMEMIGSIIGD